MYSEVKPALISVRPVGIVHFNRVFASRFKRINRHVHVAGTDRLVFECLKHL